MSLTDQFQTVMDELQHEYEVPDILLPTAQVIFVLESPHVQELKYGAPVSGSSGATMTKHLFGDPYVKYPLGLLVKKNADEAKNRPRLNRIGLMNVCNIPMQAAAYRNPAVQQRYGDWMRALGALRTANQQDEYRDEWVTAIQSVLVASLRSKLAALRNRTAVFVPCGRFAQKFYRISDVHSPSWTVIDQVPHPSYHSWDRAQYATVVARVKAALDGAAESLLS